MKVLITGGGGFLGGHIVKLLLKEGHEVTSFSRGSYPDLEAQGVKTYRGDLSDLDAVSDALKGKDAVIHCASKVAMWGRYEDFYQTNVIGTENIIKGCQANGIKALVYTSTPSVVFGQSSLKAVNEETPYPTNSVSPYGKTKAIAEEKVLKANGMALKTVALRPHLVFGPGDKNLIPRLLEKAKNGKLKRIGDGQNLVDVLYVENGAKAHILALHQLTKDSSKIAGEAFFLGQGPVNLWDFINSILKSFKAPTVQKSVSFKSAYLIGSLIERFCKLFGIYQVDPPMTRFVALQLSHDHYFDHTKAKNILGWEPEVSIEEGLSNLIDT